MVSPADKDTWVVIAVHGVGITSPGQTVENLVATINKVNPGSLDLEDPPAQRFLLERKDQTVNRNETESKGNGTAPTPLKDSNEREPEGNGTAPAPLRDRFPMHVRSATIGNAADGTPKRAVFGEVFWADISASSKGFWDLGGWWQIVIQVFTILFQLRYIAHQAATYPGLRSMWFLRWFAYLIWWFLCGPLAGVSACVVFLIAAHWAMVRSVEFYEKMLDSGPDSIVGPIVLIILALIVMIVLGVRAGKNGKRSSAKTILRLASPAVVSGLLIGTLAWGLSQNATGAKALGLGVTSSVLGFLLWGAIRSYQKDGTWELPFFCFGLCGLGIFGLSFFRLVALVDGHGPVWLIELLSKWWPRAELESSTLTFYLALSLAVNQLTCLCLGIVALVAFLSWLCVIYQTRGGGKDCVRSGATAALTTSLMSVGLWVLIVPFLGMVALSRLGSEGYSQHVFDRTWSRFAFNWLLALVPIGTALVVYWVGQHRARGYRVNKGIGNPPLPVKPIPRLIASPWITGAILVVTLIGFGMFIGGLFTGRERVHEFFTANESTIRTVSGIVMLFVMVVLGIIFIVGRESWLAVLHILNDIVGHFFRHRIPLSELWSDPPPAISWEAVGDYIRGYETEMTLEKRFRLVLEELLRDKRVARLTVIGHSQGTVIAFHGLCDPENRRLVQEAGVSQVEFVTMGSPLYHLYQYYFPHRYPPLYLSNWEFDKVSWRELEQHVDHWLNLYRVDDFIGTEIEGGMKKVAGGKEPFPYNRLIYGRGHIGYWTDAEAIGNAWRFLLWHTKRQIPTEPPPPGDVSLNGEVNGYPVILGELKETTPQNGTPPDGASIPAGASE